MDGKRRLNSNHIPTSSSKSNLFNWIAGSYFIIKNYRYLPSGWLNLPQLVIKAGEAATNFPN